MAEADLFTSAGDDRASAPLAARMRPRTLEEVAGQQRLLVPGSPLRRLVDGDGRSSAAGPVSVVLWGPPGSGKTTLAHLVSDARGQRFVQLSAVTAGVKDVRAVVEEARRDRGAHDRGTVLFVDEVHRFSKTQQDALLPAVENGWVTLVAATTENPHFSVVSPLLSRSLVLRLDPLDDGDVRTLLRRAALDDRGLGGRPTVDEAALDFLVRLAGGDARRALTALEAAAGVAESTGAAVVDEAAVSRAVDRAALRYDRDGDEHYDVTSALIKFVRGSDVDAALHYLARMVEAGEDARFLARRLMILASEDVGLADPTALPVAVAAAEAVERIGLPEGRLPLAQAVIHLSLAPKSNAVITAVDAAIADVRAGRTGAVPVHLRDAHYRGARTLGHGTEYRYPHDSPDGALAQEYAPEPVRGRRYYAPTGHGAEARLGEVLARLRAALGRG